MINLIIYDLCSSFYKWIRLFSHLQRAVDAADVEGETTKIAERSLYNVYMQNQFWLTIQYNALIFTYLHVAVDEISIHTIHFGYC